MKHTLTFKDDEILGMDLYKSKDGYNYAMVRVKKGKNQHMMIDYEWEGEETPDFIIDMMSFIGNKKEEASLEDKEEFDNFVNRLKAQR